MRVIPHHTAWLSSLIATFEPTRRARRPALGLDFAETGGRRVAVRERTELRSPFFRLIHFEKDAARQGPPVLVVAPLSGHFSALLRDMLAGLLPSYDLRLLDWEDARDVTPAAGGFGLEDNIGAVIDCIRRLAGELHVVALCQSAMPALAATALLAAQHEAPTPASLILLNGMIDTRLRPTRIDRIAARRSPAWFRQFALATVPPPYRGAGRAVYPATMQHAALVAYLMRHITTGGELLRKVVDDDGLDAAAHPFLELYLSVMDLPAEFFLDSIRLVFQEFALPRGRLAWRGSAVDPAAIRATALMTIEGEYDDVSGPGQTRVAHTLCRNVPRGRRAHYLQLGASHFGTFHGALWQREVLPRLDGFIREMR
ncbi:MAG TPA: polyhydroxyalkanoate depolymerase [Stellaceae bacterium]|nr:polyhydroxyalkanoate depolymerase [Stellaceae bacterium]